MNQSDISIKTTRNIHSLKEDWECMDEQATLSINRGDLHYMDYTFYQTYRWNCFMYDTYNHLLIHTEYIVASMNGKASLILPLMIDSLNKRLRILSGRIAGICNVACPYKGETAKSLIQATYEYLETHYKGGWKYKFRDLPIRSALVEILTERGEQRFDKGSYHVPVASFESYEAYLSSLGKNIYKNIRKAYNHLTTDGKAMRLDCYTKDSPPSHKLLRKIWKIYFLRKLAWNNQHHTFWRKIVCNIKAFKQTSTGRQTKSMLRLKESELYVLTIDDRIAAFMHTYLHNGHVLMPKLAIDASYSRYSPGILLIQEAMKQYIDRGIVDFDMCRGDERYKIEVGGINEPLTGFTISC